MWPLEIIKRMNAVDAKTRTPNGRLLSSTIEYAADGITVMLVYSSGRRCRKYYPAIFSVTEAQDKVNELIHSIGV